MRDGVADDAETEDTELRSGKGPAEWILAARPSAVTDKAVGAAKVAGQCDDEPNRDVGDIGCEHAGGGGDPDAAPLDLLHVEAVRSRAEARDDLESGKLVEQIGADG